MRRTTACSVMNATIDIAPLQRGHLDLHLVYEPQQLGPAPLASTESGPVTCGLRRFGITSHITVTSEGKVQRPERRAIALPGVASAYAASASREPV